jgi:hypothetical protein
VVNPYNSAKNLSSIQIIWKKAKKICPLQAY